LSSAVHADGLGNGIVNASGRFGNEIGTIGANANRKAANNLFQQGLQDEAQGLATMNVGLMSKALTEGLSGVQADDQSRHFGQQAMKALNVGADSGNVILGKYGTSEDQIRDFANNSAQLMPTAQGEFDKFGIQVNHDQSLLKTPFGDYPLNTSIDDHAGDLAKIISTVAEEHGLSSKDVVAGVQAGLATRNSIAQKAMDDAQKEAAAAKAAAAAGAGNTANVTASATGKMSDPKADASAAARGPASNKAPVIFNVPSGNGKDFDMQQRLLSLNASRDEMRSRLGGEYSTQALLGDRSDNLFAIVHEKYQQMRRAGHFNESGMVYSNVVAAVPNR
jgi:hypothetical protein